MTIVQQASEQRALPAPVQRRGRLLHAARAVVAAGLLVGLGAGAADTPKSAPTGQVWVFKQDGSTQCSDTATLTGAQAKQAFTAVNIEVFKVRKASIGSGMSLGMDCDKPSTASVEVLIGSKDLGQAQKLGYEPAWR